jgi:hypothetical protein
MRKKKNDHKTVCTQLDLPFESNITRKPSATKVNNIIDFSSRVQNSFEKEEREIRRKSAEYLLNYAAKLDW